MSSENLYSESLRAIHTDIDGTERYISPIGPIELLSSAGKIVFCHFTNGEDGSTCIPNALTNACVTELSEYFAGKRKVFDIPLTYAGTDFQRMVLHLVEKIPFGEVITYQDLAIRLDKPSGSRVIGNVIGRNPLLVLVPCHRILGQDGKITGYAGGIDRKRWLLQHEMNLTRPLNRLF